MTNYVSRYSLNLLICCVVIFLKNAVLIIFIDELMKKTFILFVVLYLLTSVI